MASFAGEKSTLELRDDGVMHLRWFPGVRIEVEDAQAAIAAVQQLSQGHPRPLLIDMTGTSFLTRQARYAFADANTAARIALLGSSPVDRMIVNFCLRRNPAPCPTRFFTSSTEAMAWLQEPRKHKGATDMCLITNDEQAVST